ncbi:hypothetical protein ACPV47_24100 [Vibrio jasicida]|uniref:hypothetical protein n=1 Tax=Vibrio jasicida TaxID=766224 RepID=UPI0040686B9B
MPIMYLSVPYRKESDNGDIKKDVDESLATGLATGFILNAQQVSYLNNANPISVVLVDRIRCRRLEGALKLLSSTGKSTRFGMRYDVSVSNLKEVAYSPVVFRYHRTGVKIVDESGQDIK